MVQSENGTISDLREICKDCRWWICLHILSSQPGGGVRSSGTPRHCQLIQAELPSNAYTRLPGVQKVIASLISSELSSHQMAAVQLEVQRVTASLIPSKLSSHQMAICSHSGLCRFSALFNPLRRIWADWMHPPRTAFTHYGFRSRQGSSPARHVPLLCLSLFPPPVSLSWYLYV